MMHRWLDRFRRDKRGNITIMFALAAIPILFGLGMSVDYGAATRRRAHMNAAADAAALAAVTPTLMNQPTSTALANATLIFNGQVKSISGIDPTKISLCIRVTDTTGVLPSMSSASPSCPVLVSTPISSVNLRVRTTVVSYSAPSTNVFGTILHSPTMQIGGSSTSSATVSPNIDFYLMLDTSPSMAIPATQAGIDAMVAATPYQDGLSGCAFACHESNPSAESGSAKYTSPIFGNPGCPDDPKQRPKPCLDNYALFQSMAQSFSPPLALRIDLVNQAVVNLIDTAKTTEASTGAAYRLAAYTFDATVSNPVSLQVPSNTAKQQAASGINLLEVAQENSNNGDQNTVFDGTNGGFTVVTKAMNSANNGTGAGAGTNLPGDNPQQVLMIVSDGVADEPNQANSRIYTPLGYNTTMGNSLTNSTCTTLKQNPNVRIAVLYLVYNPLPLNGGSSWYSQKISSEQPSISPVMQNCASPGLFYQVNTGGDISAAMTTLFQSAVKAAHLTN